MTFTAPTSGKYTFLTGIDMHLEKNETIFMHIEYKSKLHELFNIFNHTDFRISKDKNE